MILGCNSGSIREIKSCNDRMETQFRKSTFKECSYFDQCLLFGDSPSLFFNLNSERAKRSGNEEYITLLQIYPASCSQTIVETLVGREAILFFFKQTNISVELSKEMVREFFRENLQNSCGNFTESALESLRKLVSEMHPQGMYSFLSLLEFQENHMEKKINNSFQCLFVFSIILSLIISSIVLLDRRSKNLQLSCSRIQFEQKLEIMKRLFQKLKEQDQHISQAENTIMESLEKSVVFTTTIKDQEMKISEFGSLLNCAINDSKAKDSTLATTKELLNKIRDVIHSEISTEHLDLNNIVESLKSLLRDKAEKERISTEKNFLLITERNGLSLKCEKLKKTTELISFERDELEEKVNQLEESLISQKETNQSLEDSVIKQADYIGKILHSLKMKEDQEQKLISEIEKSKIEILTMEKHFNHFYRSLKIFDKKNPEIIQTKFENLREESERKEREIKKLQQEIKKIEENMDEQLSKLFEINSKVASLQEENCSLKSQLVEAKKRADLKDQENIDTIRKISKLNEVLKTKSELYENLERESKDEKDKRHIENQQLNEMSVSYESTLSTLKNIVEENDLLKNQLDSLTIDNQKLKRATDVDEKENIEKNDCLLKLQSELSSCKHNHEKCCKDLIREKDKISKLLETNAEISQKYEKMCSTVAERRSIYEEARSVIEEKSTKIEQLLLIIENMKNSLEFKDQEIVGHENNTSVLLNTIKEIQSCLSISPIETNSIVHFIKDMQEQQKKIVDNLEIEIHGLRGDLEIKSNIIVDYQQKINEITELLEGRAKKIDELDIELQLLKKEKSNLENDIIEQKKLVEEKGYTINELSNKLHSLEIETLNKETILREKIETISREKELLKEKVEKMDEALSKKVNKIDNAFNCIQILNSESENLSFLNKEMEDKYMRVLFEKKQLTEQKEKYEKIIESLKSHNEKLLDELNHQQMILLKIEKSNKNNLEKESKKTGTISK